MTIDNNVPQEIKKWNWGAFFLSWIWGIFNKAYISLLVFVPIVGFIIPFYLGARGNAIAWNNKQWESLENFVNIQKLWSRAGVIIAFLMILVFLLITSGIFLWMSNAEPVKQSVDIINNNNKATNILGKPIKKGFFVSGDISVQGPSGSADVSVPIKGTKKKGTLYIKASKQFGRWIIKYLVLEVDEKTYDIDIEKY